MILRILVAAALAVDALVHIRLAPGYQLAAPDGIGEGNLFYLESAAAIVAALYVLIRGSRPAFGLALLVLAAGLAAVLLYHYVDVPAIGPIPAMYDPLWFPEKSISAIAQGFGVAFAVAGLARLRR
ncbi:hypothetical protein [Arthrobacter sp. H14-L1]|uniref:hypothetical protein n=1 Tax=Arthrobacter sp. H14-L1 TaxID=2996697 RepID=UPI0022714CF1|nr:hypothetical protein [Arthrobacter sp. H14-L1]